MELSLYTLILLPLGLGLLGFVEPCTIGGHLLFLDTQKDRSQPQKLRAVGVFVLIRSIVAGLAGAVFAYLGQELVAFQTGLAVFFGAMYLAIGGYFLLGMAGVFNRQYRLSAKMQARARNPALLGAAFGLNIPATAAPILFVLLGLSLSVGSVFSGMVMMFVFGLALSLPLLLVALSAQMSERLDRLAISFQRARFVIAVVFIGLGLWSIWFGLFVDPQFWNR